MRFVQCMLLISWRVDWRRYDHELAWIKKLYKPQTRCELYYGNIFRYKKQAK